MHVPVFLTLPSSPFLSKGLLQLSPGRVNAVKEMAAAFLNILYSINILATEYFDRAVARIKKMGGRTSCEKVNGVKLWAEAGYVL